MIQITDSVWIGNSSDESHGALAPNKIGAILNVSQDLKATRGWGNGLEYNQVGLIDGPGNPPSAYYAAVLALATLLKRTRVLVCCHGGNRSLVVALMYLQVVTGTPARTWQEWIDLLEERLEVNLPIVRGEHREVFDTMNWKALMRITGE